MGFVKAKSHKAFVFVTAGLLIGLGSAGWLASAAHSSQSHAAAEQLATVNSKTLQNRGLFVSEPTVEERAVSAAAQSAALDLALRTYPDSVVRETALVKLVAESTQPAQTCLCWVISLNAGRGLMEGGGGPAYGSKEPQQRADYFLVFVDALTGKGVMTVSGTAVP